MEQSLHIINTFEIRSFLQIGSSGFLIVRFEVRYRNLRLLFETVVQYLQFDTKDRHIRFAKFYSFFGQASGFCNNTVITGKGSEGYSAFFLLSLSAYGIVVSIKPAVKEGSPWNTKSMIQYNRCTGRMRKSESGRDYGKTRFGKTG